MLGMVWIGMMGVTTRLASILLIKGHAATSLLPGASLSGMIHPDMCVKYVTDVDDVKRDPDG